MHPTLVGPIMAAETTTETTEALVKMDLGSLNVLP